jgi:DNA-binding transcriptional LysR family regulator
MKTTDVVSAVADGRIDIGIVREDAIPPETKRYRLGGIGYVAIGANAHWKGCVTATDLLKQAPVVDLLPGGKFAKHWQQWLNEEKIQPNVVTKVNSFADMARIVLGGQAVAVLPELAIVDFDAKKFKHQKIDELKALKLAIIWNTRSLERLSISDGAVRQLAQILTYDTTDTIF